MKTAKEIYQNYTYRKNKYACRNRLATAGSLDPANQRQTLDEIEFIQTTSQNRIWKSVCRWLGNVQPQAGTLLDCTD
jgi:hypothetical protein